VKLQNQDIWLAYPNLKRLQQVEFPLEVSLGIAKQIKALQIPYSVIEFERKRLVNHYGVEKDGQVTVDNDSPQAGDFAVAFGNLLTEVWGEDIPIERVTLPAKVESTCEDCGHKREVVFLIDPQILIPLFEDFISQPAGLVVGV
jgi:hypothetical protein